MNIHRALRFTLKTLPAIAVLFVATEAHARCPPGYFRNRFGRCVPLRVVVPAGCPAGYVMNRFGRCVPAVVAPRACPPGYFYFRGRCIIRR